MQDYQRARRVFDDRSPYVDRFGLLLAFVVLAVVLLSLVDLSTADTRVAGWLAVGTTAAVAATLSVALRASGLARRWQRVVDLVLVAGVLLLVVLGLAESPGAEVSPPLATVLLAALAPAVVVRRLLRHRQVFSGTLLGALSAYLLIALAFYFAFLATNHFSTQSFFGQAEPTTSYMYFSLTTITTLGYGDLSPVSDGGRLLATSEAVVGQVFLVTVVAMIVGLLAQQWGAGPRGADDAPPSSDDPA